MVFELVSDGIAGVLNPVSVGFELGDIFPQVRDQVIAQEYLIIYFFDGFTSLTLLFLFFCFVLFETCRCLEYGLVEKVV